MNCKVEDIYRKVLESGVVDHDPEKVLEINKYLRARKHVHSERLVFATHEKAFQLKHLNQFIMDEDILPRLVRNLQVKVSDVKTVLAEALKTKGTSMNSTIVALRKALRAKPDVITKGLMSSTQGVKSMAGNVPPEIIAQVCELLVADAFMRVWSPAEEEEHILCMKRRALLEEPTYIVLSATANQKLYESVFGHRLNFINIPPTENKGRMLLHTRRSFSKQSIRDNEDAFLERVIADKERYGFDGVIAHLFIAKKLADAGIPVKGTFHALEGLDRLGGMNLAIYGTPRRPAASLKLWAHTLGLKTRQEDWEHGERVIERNGFEFRFCTNSSRQDLQELELSLIESELMQAVGRARLVRNDCEVHVFSNLPLPGGILIEEAEGLQN